MKEYATYKANIIEVDTKVKKANKELAVGNSILAKGKAMKSSAQNKLEAARNNARLAQEKLEAAKTAK